MMPRHPTTSQLDYMDLLARECGFTDGATAARVLYGLTPGPVSIQRILTGLRTRRDLPVIRSGPAVLTYKNNANGVGHLDLVTATLFATPGQMMLEGQYEVTNTITGEITISTRTFHWSAVVDLVWYLAADEAE